MSADRLWVPLIGHYREEAGTRRLDTERMLAHVAAIRGDVSQYLLAGSTGDGWELDDAALREVALLATREELAGTTALVGALGATTGDVVRRARLIEAALANGGAARFGGLAVCAPIDAAASQPAILAHYEAVLAATECPIAVYELPQVTQCRIAPQTMQRLAENPRVTMLKDTSGEDRLVAGASAVTTVRGAEGRYYEALTTMGYDGLLLSTANAFARPLRRMIEHVASGRDEDAAAISALLTATIEALFALGAALPFGNPFSNVNRAADHLLAYGRRWREVQPPLTYSGNRLPMEMLERVDDRLLGIGERGEGYLG